ncbi:thiamine diphosphokinase [Tissierella creatinini]|nr:thiamine diphosphokinase [Tissierella creatinini]TJX69194.1 thiamine diphosphokinase [Soehngenia saccharolytica]
MKGLIISAGNIKNYKRLKDLISNIDFEFILCADGGIRHAISLDRVPNAVIGDLDSTAKEDLKYIDENSIQVIKYPVEKDETDTELAIEYLISRRIKDITLIGGTGSRIDHTMANILLLHRLMIKGIDGRIIDEHNIIQITDKCVNLRKKKDYNISIIPISNDGIVVSLKGFYYPLENKRIQFGSTLGISNRIVNDIGIINIIKGLALIIESID